MLHVSYEKDGNSNYRRRRLKPNNWNGYRLETWRKSTWVKLLYFPSDLDSNYGTNNVFPVDIILDPKHYYALIQVVIRKGL